MGVGKALLAGALAANLLALLFWRIDAFPALHGDEAWVGLHAAAIGQYGVRSVHEMNHYTGALYPWLVSGIFRRLGPGIFSLRLLGVALNAAAAALMLVHLARRWSWSSALAWLGLLSGSAFFLLKSKVAWEVYALQPLLLAVVLILSRGFAARGRFPAAKVLLFLGANYLGVLNHFIFLSVGFSLLVWLLWQGVAYEAWEPEGFFTLAWVNLLMCLAFCSLKYPLSDAAWLRHPAALAGLFLLLPAAAYGVFRASLGRDARLRESLARLCLGRALRGWLALGLALFFVFHLKALVQIWSGVAVFERLASWEPPSALRAFLTLWAAALLGAYFFYALRALAPRRFSALSRPERLMVLWPLAYASVFILMRNTNSIRYYVLPSFLLTASLAVILPRLWEEFDLRAALVPAAAFILATGACCWREVLAPRERAPLEFRVGWHMERSRDFLSKESLYRVMDREGVCSFPEEESFTDLPLQFYRLSHPIPCARGKTAAVRYCQDCSRPPYFAWCIRER